MKKNSFVQGAMVATIGVVISKLLGIVYVVPFYAIIGAQGGALYGYAYTIYNIFLSLSSVGIPLAISRLTSEHNSLNQQELKLRTFKIAKTIITTLSLISFIVLIIFAPNIAYFFIGDIKGGNTIEDVTFVIRVIATAILVVPRLSVTKGYLQGHSYITVSTISQVLEQIVRVTFIIAGSYIAIKLFHSSIRVGVGVATFGATIGGLAAYLYVRYNMHKHKHQITPKSEEEAPKSDVKNKDIAIRILGYATAFVFSSVALSSYDLVDLSTILKTMVNGLAHTVEESETVLSIFSTWGSKLNMIVASAAAGLLTSLVPNITNSFVQKDYRDVRNKINKSLQILFYITIPMTIGLSLLAKPVWTIFYQYDEICSSIFMIYIFMALFSSALATLNAIIQALSFQKIMFINITTGFIIKILFNVPMMYLFAYFGLHPAYGAIATTLLGFSSSIILNLCFLKRKLDINYKETLVRAFKILISCIIMAIIVIVCKALIPLDLTIKKEAFLATILYGSIGAITYFGLTYKLGLIRDIFGMSFINKLSSRLKLRH